uniref:Uncharacterized protein n=1 Tax=Arcella intermedia TaxID=1963864 RepID=A0A6B2L3V3_9EUKA
MMGFILNQMNPSGCEEDDQNDEDDEENEPNEEGDEDEKEGKAGKDVGKEEVEGPQGVSNEEGDEDEKEGKAGKDVGKEEVEGPQGVSNEEGGPKVAWIEGVGQVTDTDTPAAPSPAPPPLSPSPSLFVDVLAEEASDFFTTFVKGISSIFQESKVLLQGTTLYDKYKSKIVGEDSSSVASSIADVPDSMEIALARFIPPMAEIFGPSLIAREALRKKGIECTWSLRNSTSPQVQMVYQLANTMDEEAYVLHPLEKKGFLVEISGCSDNKILGIALAAALIEPDEGQTGTLLTGKRPPGPIINLLQGGTPQSLENIQWSHPWTFANWTAIRKDGSIPTGMAGASHWLWTEGSPNEILKWNDKKVIVLGKAPFPRKFTPVRVFEGLTAQVRVVHPLTPEEYNKLVLDIGNTEETKRNEALKNHKKWQQ